jgi:hypothetical protein
VTGVLVVADLKVNVDIDYINYYGCFIFIMVNDWQELTRLTGGEVVEVERVRIVKSAVAIEGRFTLPPLAQLPGDDQIFVSAFVRCHGSIKQMEKYFGVSYPTIKNRLNKIGSQLSFVEIEQGADTDQPPQGAGAVLDRVSRGELTVAQALEQLKETRGDRHE